MLDLNTILTKTRTKRSLYSSNRRLKYSQRREFFSTPTNTSPLQQKIPSQERTVQILNNPHSRNPNFRTRENFAPPPTRNFPYAPPHNAPKPSVKCFVFSEEVHSTGRCHDIIDNQNKKWVIRKGFNYLYPNCERVPIDGKFSPKYPVREVQKEQEIGRKLEENNKEEQKKKDRATEFISMD
ncbi:hypothetical protein O181_002210 [Austropuccinia psidii MF-1]|uniref:Uncharacterized protein n=1 Tax=Austropuccinia psidii MF-1 TaxID=1389203 RepID=A0A9Q3BCL1_9BASI|nr:hypothetical protein [Austropuccinia psidii MF-1]